MENLKGFIQKKLYAVLSKSEIEFETYLKELKLLPIQKMCLCGGKMTERLRHQKRTWRCTTYSCRKEVGYLKETFFDHSHLTLKEILKIHTSGLVIILLLKILCMN